MLAKRIIPCLDIKDGETVKGINFLQLKEVGDPVALGRRYAEEGADELVYLDISATFEGRKTFAELVTRIAENINIPFTVGGGISTVDDAGRLLGAGADKVSINSAAVRNPELISQIASKYGDQFVVVAIDAKMVDGEWRVTTHGGRNLTERELFTWAKEAENRGAERFSLLRWTMTAQKTATLVKLTPNYPTYCRFRSLHREVLAQLNTLPTF